MYNVTVKIEGIESRRRSAGLLHIVIGFFLIAKGADFFKQSGYTSTLPLMLILGVAAISLFYGFFRRKMDPFAKYNYWLRLVQVISFTGLGVAMIRTGRSIDYIGVFIFAFLAILLLFSERRIFTETTLFFDNAGVSIPGYYRDHLVPWKDLTEVVIREDFVTLFHKKQKYLQFQVMQDLSTLEVAKMNAFCREQLEAAGTLQQDQSEA